MGVINSIIWNFSIGIIGLSVKYREENFFMEVFWIWNWVVFSDYGFLILGKF